MQIHEEYLYHDLLQYALKHTNQQPLNTDIDVIEDKCNKVLFH